MTRTTMLDGTICYSGPHCRKHAFAFQQIALMSPEQYQQLQASAMKPEDKAYWDPELNRNFNGKFNAWSSDKAHWYDPLCGHHWERPIREQTRYHKCPQCAKARVTIGVDDMQTLRPKMSKQWDHDANGDLLPKHVTLGSNREVGWICPRGHKYNMSPYNRTSRHHGCYYCRNYYVLVGWNDLQSQYPQIALELHPTLNPGITAADVIATSHNKYWWRCAAGHEWEAEARKRTLRGQGCKECAGRASSVIEGLFHDVAADFLTNMKDHHAKFMIPWRRNKSMTIDISGEYRGSKIAMEYDGEYSHGKLSKDVKIDLDKTKALLQAGFKVVRFRENSLPNIDLKDPNLLQINYNSNGYRARKDIEKAMDKARFWLDSRT